jgi:DNA-binding NarL/FixJ family response regulator
MEKQRVLIVEDDSFTRVTLGVTVRALGCDVIGEVDSVTQALRIARDKQPSVAVLDLDLGAGPTGIDLARALRRSLPDIGIVMLSTYEEPRLIGPGQPDLPVGTIYLVKRSLADPHVLGWALRQSTDRETWASPSAPDRRTAALTALSDQQIEIMRLVAAGLSNAEIGRRRCMTEAAVGKAVARLIRQLDLRASQDQNQRVLIAQRYFELTGATSARRT